MGLLNKKKIKRSFIFHPFNPKKGVSLGVPYKIEHPA
tara:strand:- start:1713 stop:1823 length:111 start_codon:yes stop_codon:yes gene_type:complete